MKRNLRKKKDFTGMTAWPMVRATLGYGTMTSLQLQVPMFFIRELWRLCLWSLGATFHRSDGVPFCLDLVAC